MVLVVKEIAIAPEYAIYMYINITDTCTLILQMHGFV